MSRAYGAPVQVDGEELIPVALVSFGFGGGGSDDADGEGNPAGGGGGGGFVLPLGVYGRGAGGNVVFRPNTIALLAGLVPVVCAVGISVRGILRTLRR
ncbi:spore germination protein GerW family protein [Arthrobacter sp. RHLT1-20]